jgi:hypothetical protein
MKHVLVNGKLVIRDGTLENDGLSRRRRPAARFVISPCSPWRAIRMSPAPPSCKHAPGRGEHRNEMQRIG